MFDAIVSAASSLAGGLFGKKQADKQAKLQKQFAKHGISWKVKDAKNAGIHPLYALGANTTSYQPVSVGGGLETALPSMGQDIGRAINSQLGESGKAQALSLAAQALQNEGLKLDNDIKRADLASRITTMNQPGTPAGVSLADPVFSNAAGLGLRLQKQFAPAAAGKPESEAGLGPEVAWYRSKTGWVPQIPMSLSESFEGEPMELSGAQWFLRNKVAPVGGNAYFNPPFKAPAGKAWKFNPVMGQYELVSAKSVGRSVFDLFHIRPNW